MRYTLECCAHIRGRVRAELKDLPFTEHTSSLHKAYLVVRGNASRRCSLLLPRVLGYSLCADITDCFTSERLLSKDNESRRKSSSNQHFSRALSSFGRASFALDYGLSHSTVDKVEQVFVRYHDDNVKANVLAAAYELIEDVENEDLIIVKMKQSILEQLRGNGLVEAETDNKVAAFVHVHEHVPFSIRQRLLEEEVPYGIKMIQADQLDVGSHNVTVCIIDTGYAEGHPDLPLDTTGTSTPERNFTWNEDLNGHGTHTAGVVAAIGGNKIGVVGAGNIKLHITRGLDEFSAGYESDVLRAVTQCVSAGAKVISISLGSYVMSSTASDLYTKTVEEDGVIIVAAAGNQGKEGKPLDAFPASHPSVISVAAVYEWGSYWEGSNFNDQVELAAPGHRVLSTSVSTSVVHASDFSYPAQRVSGAPTSDVSGTLVHCGPGNYICSEASGAICLMDRDETTLSTMIANCEAGGGIGAVIFDAVQGGSRVTYENWNADSNIPAVGVQYLAGIELLEEVNTSVHLGLATGDNREYSYSYFSGTSMASPHVAAAAALVWSHFPECINHQIRHALVVTAHDQGIEGCDWDYGFGIVKAKDAYDFLAAHPCNQGDWWQPTSGDRTPVCERKFPNVTSGDSNRASITFDSDGSPNSPSLAPSAAPEAATATESVMATSSSTQPHTDDSCISIGSISFIMALVWLF